MSGDAIFGIANKLLIQSSMDVDRQLADIDGARPVVAMLMKARKEAAESVRPLIDCDATDATKIRELQGKLRRYDDLVRWLQEIVTHGMFLKGLIDDEDRQELVELLQPASDLEYFGQVEEVEDGDADQG